MSDRNRFNSVARYQQEANWIRERDEEERTNVSSGGFLSMLFFLGLIGFFAFIYMKLVVFY